MRTPGGQNEITEPLQLVEEKQAFVRDGHIKLAGLFDARDIAELDAALRDAKARRTGRSNDVDRSLSRDMFLSRESSELAAFVRDSRIGSTAATLLDARCIRFIQDVLLEKSGAQSETPWHRDSDFWSVSGIGALTVWIPLQPLSLQMSPLRFATGSHRVDDPRPPARLDTALLRLRYRIASSPLELGDVTVHHYRTLHGAARNRGTGTRRSLAIHLIDGEARVRTPRFPGQIEHAEGCGWNRLREGDPFPDDIAPLVWQSRSGAGAG